MNDICELPDQFSLFIHNRRCSNFLAIFDEITKTLVIIRKENTNTLVVLTVEFWDLDLFESILNDVKKEKKIHISFPIK